LIIGRKIDPAFFTLAVGLPVPQQDRTRDHLANERTFLAWVRTALGLLGLGFVLARMGIFLRQIAAEIPGAQPNPANTGHEFLVSGVVFLAIGTGLTGLSAWIHDRNRRAIEAGTYKPAHYAIYALAAIIMTGGLIIVSLVIWRTPTLTH
jgi:putative membrane protein